MRDRGRRSSKTLQRRKRGDWGEGLLALEAKGLLTQDAEPGGTTFVDAHNGFNKLIYLTMLWTVHHRWLAEARSAFNCYRHWAQLILHQLGDAPVIPLSQAGVT